MAGVVTVIGGSGAYVPVTVNGAQAFSLAQAYQDALNTAGTNGALSVATGIGGSNVVDGTPGSTDNEFEATTGGFYTYPSGFNYFTTDTTDKVFIDATAGTSSETLNTLIGTGGATYLAGNESGQFIAGGGNNLFIDSGSGNYTIATSDGNDSIFAGSGNDYVAAGTGNNLITLGSGADTVISSGTDQIYAGSGPDTISLSGTGSTVYGGSGALIVDDTLATSTSIQGGSGAASIFGGTDSFYQLSGISTVYSGTSDTITAAGDSTVYGASSTDLIETGSSSLLFIGGAGVSTVSSGMGTATVFGTNGSNITYSGAGVLVATAGNETLNGAGSTQGFVAYVSNIAGLDGTSIAGGTGSDTLVAGMGNQTLSGGSGAANVFVLAANGTLSSADITISDFGSATGNLVALYGYGSNEIATALSTAVTSGGNTTISLADGSKVTFLNVSHLSASSFVGDA